MFLNKQNGCLQFTDVESGYNPPQPHFLLTYPHNLSYKSRRLRRLLQPDDSHAHSVSDAAEPPFVLRKSSAAAADQTADPSLPAAGQLTLLTI